MHHLAKVLFNLNVINVSTNVKMTLPKAGSCFLLNAPEEGAVTGGISHILIFFFNNFGFLIKYEYSTTENSFGF